MSEPTQIPERDTQHANIPSDALSSDASPVTKTSPASIELVDRTEALAVSEHIPDSVPAPHTPNEPTAAASAASVSTTQPVEDEELYNVKSIWFPPILSVAQPERRQRFIVLQYRNGPCSLLALINLLLLKGKIALPTRYQRQVPYSVLANLAAEYILNQMSSSATDAATASAILSSLPKSRYGLEVNIGFDSISSFLPYEDHGELALFEKAGLKLVHGWCLDREDKETWNAMHARDCMNYDKASATLATADSLSGEVLVHGDAASDDAIVRAIEAQKKWTEEQADLVRDSYLIRNFLQDSSSQLTYAGIFQLSAELQTGSLCALYRNNHLSVLYRRLEPEDAFSPVPEDTLYQLVTDDTFQWEENLIWESLGSIDGADSSFFSSELRRTRIEGDAVRHEELVQQQHVPEQQDYDAADHALAMQMQQEEQDHYEHYEQQSARVQTSREPQSLDPNSRDVPPRSIRPQRTRPLKDPRPKSVPSQVSGTGTKTRPAKEEKKKKDCIIS